MSRNVEIDCDEGFLKVLIIYAIELDLELLESL